MNTCACNGIRICKICSSHSHNDNSKINEHHIFKEIVSKLDQQRFYLFCSNCSKAFHVSYFPDIFNTANRPDLIYSRSDNTYLEERECKHNTKDYIDIEGISLYDNFVSVSEEDELVKIIDETKWVESQSGRRKQDYGPKVNFKKRKLRLANFTGLPPYSESIVNRFTTFIEDFRPVEMCCLDYKKQRGSSIDPHFDDVWIWGERLITLNLISTTFHTLVRDSNPNIEVLVRLPARTLVVCSGDSRYMWRHGIRREHVAERRVALTFRELPPSYLEEGEHWSVGQKLLETASGYNGIALVT